MRWLRRIGLLLAFVVLAGLVAAWDGLRGDRADEGPTATTAPAGQVAAPGEGDGEDPRIACAAALPARQQLAQLLALPIDGTAPDLEAQRIADLGIGTVLLDGLTADRPIARVEALKEASSIPPLVAVAEEGGSVQGLRAVLGPFPSAERVVATVDPAGAGELVAGHAQSMATLGIDVVLGPVVDVLPGDGRDPLGGDRTFSDDPAVVTEYGAAYVDAFVAAGLLPTLKHFPGHGSATGDSHVGLASVPPLPQLRERDLLPYETLLERPVAVMVGNMVVPDVTIFGAASLSEGIVTDLLRDEYGFNGLVFTDSLSTGIVTRQGPAPERAYLALRAGADVALFAEPVQDPAAVLRRLEQALNNGNLDADRIATSVVRVLDVKGVDPCAL